VVVEQHRDIEALDHQLGRSPDIDATVNVWAGANKVDRRCINSHGNTRAGICLPQVSQRRNGMYCARQTTGPQNRNFEHRRRVGPQPVSLLLIPCGIHALTIPATCVRPCLVTRGRACDLQRPSSRKVHGERMRIIAILIGTCPSPQIVSPSDGSDSKVRLRHRDDKATCRPASRTSVKDSATAGGNQR